MKRELIEDLLIAACLLLFLSLEGCTGMLIGNALGQGENLTPEQVKAYNEVGSQVVGCFQVGGPPPAGNTQWIILPKGAPLNVKFGDNCHLVQ